MKTLVTGATGFIGTHLVQALVKEGREVRCLTRNSDKKSLLENNGVEVVYGNLLDKDSLKSAVNGVKIIYHLAGEVYTDNVETYYKTNINGTRNLIETCINNSIEKFIFFSSIAATGPCLNNEQMSEETCCMPISPYGKSKLECEKLISCFSEQNKLTSVIIRPPVVYGPGINESSRALKLIQTIKQGKIIIPGNGNHRISLCYITNLIQGTLLAEKKAREIGGKYILSDHSPYTYNYIVDTIAAELGIAVSKFHVPQRLVQSSLEGLQYMRSVLRLPDSISIARLQETIQSWNCDISKAKRDLGYNPSVELHEGFKLTLGWCREKKLIN